MIITRGQSLPSDHMYVDYTCIPIDHLMPEVHVLTIKYCSFHLKAESSMSANTSGKESEHEVQKILSVTNTHAVYPHVCQ